MSIMNIMKERKFLLATQYYRAPTPLPEEWEEDLVNIKKLGLEAVQLRIQWRWNEKKEGAYNFDDIDRLFDLAEKTGLDVIIKFMLETAPEYIYRKYKGYRISPSGELIYSTANGAFYVGGWLPCFDNPDVREKGGLFIREIAKRYRDRKSLILYNAWNEPRSRPGTECACSHSVRSYQNWLKEKFGTVEELNNKYGKAWGDFEDVYPPSGTGDYSEMYLWRHWAAFSVKDRVRWTVENIKQVDNKRQVICHVGMCLPCQDVLNDTSDDMLNAEEVDIYGTSLPFGTGELCGNDKNSDLATFNNGNRKHFYVINLLPDWIRGIRKNFYSYEIYANNMHYSILDLKPEDLKFYIHSQIAAGAKGICFWQYKPERFGSETGCSGLVNLDGSPTDRSVEVGRILKDIKGKRELLENYEVDRSMLAVIYDFRSDMVSRLEDTNRVNMRTETTDYLYKKAFKGAYRGFFLLNILPDPVDIRRLKDACSYPFIYLPFPVILTAKEAELFRGYVENGGMLIAENSLGFRDDNTWMRTHSFPCGLDEVFGIEEDIPKQAKDRLFFGDEFFEVNDITSSFKPKGAKVLGTWEDSSPALTVNEYGKGKALAIGFHPGLLDKTEVFLNLLCDEISLKPLFRSEGRLVVRQGRSGRRKMFFLFNYGDEPVKIFLDGMNVEVGARDTKEIIVEEEKSKLKKAAHAV